MSEPVTQQPPAPLPPPDRHKGKRGSDPITCGEWQEAVDAARALLLLESARQYGLMSGEPVVHVRRCEQILKRGKARGTEPSSDCVERFVTELISQQAEAAETSPREGDRQ